ncbi:Glutathione S-transferase [Ceraceosorus bombacis]|uniref:glutathione transferase n=1 Tax=Ceraceosorus bombacis TaxID=401625 RepID=A0A0P1BIW8_9BASI|nr:Glutathione S-transferase [Ceraceosorus bombacis]
MTLIVHHLNNSRSQRVLWLLEELGVEYEIKHYKRGPDMLAPKELKQAHPLGKSPFITDTDLSGKEITLAESGAIVDFIIEKYGKGAAVPVSHEDKLENNMWSHFAEGSLMPTMVMKLIFSTVPTQAPFLVRPIVSIICGQVCGRLVDPDIKSKLTYVSEALAKRGDPATSDKEIWFAGGDKDGNPTSADYQLMFPLEASIVGGRAANAPANLKAYVEKAQRRPAYQRALAKGGEYAYAAKL